MSRKGGGLDDFLLGGIGSSIPHFHSMDHALRLLGTWSGSDKLMMTAQYGAKLWIPFLQYRAQAQYNAGIRASPVSPGVDNIFKLAGSLSIARRLSGAPGILAIFKQLSSLERNPPPSSRLRFNAQRLQGLSMLVFYPLEYIALFSSPAAPILRLPASIVRFASLWSVRAWGLYTALAVWLLYDELQELGKKEKRAEKEHTVAGDETRKAIHKRRQAIGYQLVANVSRLPVIIHWSLVNGLYKNEYISTVLSFISAIAALSGGWESHRIAPPKR